MRASTAVGTQLNSSKPDEDLPCWPGMVGSRPLGTKRYKEMIMIITKITGGSKKLGVWRAVE